MLNKPHHVQITFSHSIVFNNGTTERACNHTVQNTQKNSNYLVESMSSADSLRLPITLSVPVSPQESFKLLGLQYGRVGCFFFQNTSTATISLWRLSSVCVWWESLYMAASEEEMRPLQNFPLGLREWGEWKTHSLQVTSCQKKGGSTRLQ